MRKRLIRLLIVLPIAALIWIVGWTMSWAGADRERETRQTRHMLSPERESITVVPSILEEPPHREA